MIEKPELDDMEERATAADGHLAVCVCRLVSEVRRLHHELADPNYQYSGRIHRQAVLTRDATIARLREEVKKLTANKTQPGDG